ncbi:melanoma-associated antigen 9-like [Dama dama]|uniref:melanoma-associated antigen 9-like n=1 Tax=Dama dama TaxID=30532 RepID=UPI002A366148|nr:melanoma-associated antigen 9-like [Dama dama]
MEAHFIWGEEEEVEDEEEEQVEEGDEASPSSPLLVWGTLEEVAAAATPSLPQSPLGVCPSPTAMAATPGSQFEDHGLNYQDYLLVFLNQASEYLQLVFGLEVKEVGPSEHTCILAPTLGLTLNAMLRDGQRFPKASLLVVILCLISVEDKHVPAEEIWGALSRMAVCPGREHYIYGEPRELLSQVWVREMYLEYQQVSDGDSAGYEFL